MLFHLKARSCLLALLGSAILAFGLYNIHAPSGVTEGGVLGMTLLLEHWLGLSPAFTGFLLNAACYLLGRRMLGKAFIGYSIIAGGGFSLLYALFEQFPPLFPAIAAYPLLASLLGALFVGVGAGLSVRAGGAPSGDDALAMSLSRALGWRIERVYWITDLTVLALSATYIPLTRLGYSLLTVMLSGKLVGLVARIRRPRRAGAA